MVPKDVPPGSETPGSSVLKPSSLFPACSRFHDRIETNTPLGRLFRLTSTSTTRIFNPFARYPQFGRSCEAEVAIWYNAQGLLHRQPVARLDTPPGRLAQLGERQLDKLEVTGSSPVAPIPVLPVQA